MAKQKKKLMIPFSYGKEEMFSWCNYNYKEGTENSNKIWWDFELNERADTYAFKPDQYDHWTKEPNPNYEEEKIKYENKLEMIKERKNNGRYIEVDEIVWKENFEFEDTLYLTGMSRGRSAANFNLKSETDNKNYNVFMTDIVDIIQNSEISKGKINGKWTFVKRGQNYGVKLVK